MKILQPLLYFSLFNHPLKKEEILHYSSHTTQKDFEEEIELALSKNIIKKTTAYYHPYLNEECVSKRETGYKNAQKAMIKAKKRARFAYRFFPFIDGIAISGSLSKGYFDKHSDVDFFIITKPGRLWSCRMALILFKKIFLFNSKKYFCMNYFITSDSLEIMEKNRFTATEIATLIPLHGSVFNHFFKTNSWYKNFLPNKECNWNELENISKRSLLQYYEALFNNSIGELIERACFSITFAVWKIKYKEKMSSEDFAIAFKSSHNVSKHHPSNFQKKVIDALNKKYDEIREKYQIELPKEHA